MQEVSTIRLYLADDMVIYVLSETFPTAIWAKLEKLYMKKSLTNVLSLEVVLSTTDERRTERAEHLSNFQRILTDLLNVGEKIEEKIGHWYC